MTSEPVSMTQGFLAQVLFDTDHKIMLNPGYAHQGEVFNTAVFLLTEAFRRLMEQMAVNPNYGVKAEMTDEVRSTIGDITYADLNEAQKATVDNHGRLLELLLQDPAARIVITGLIEAYQALEEERAAAQTPPAQPGAVT